MGNRVVYKAGKVFTGHEWLHDYAVIVNEKKIEELLPVSSISSSEKIIDYKDAFIAPAFIDLQIYGAFEKLFAVYPETDALQKLTDYCRKGGAAFCMPTLATNTSDIFFKGIDAIKEYWKEGGMGVLGLHIEGPWINIAKRGAHVASLIHIPAAKEVKELLEYGRGVIKMITLAPEICSKEIIELIRSYGVIVSAGHSNATYEEAKNGFKNGITAVTHLYNAMSPLQHREPGLTGAAMDDEKIMASIIPDGHHVDFAAVRIARAVMKERLFVITDAVTTTGKGYYKHQPNGDKYEADGILSGSALTMNKAVQNLVQYCGAEPAEALRMCSLYPAQVMGLDNSFGYIKPGYTAALVVMRNDYEVLETVC